MSQEQRAGKKWVTPKDATDAGILQCSPLPFGLEELDDRLEAAFLSISEFRPEEACIWACACFLVDGSEE